MANKNQQEWVYSKKFNHYQKVNNEVYPYVRPLIYGWMAQLYKRGTVSLCDCEVRTSDMSKDGFEKMKEIADQWLNEYGDDYEASKGDQYHISNPLGVWANHSQKKYWI